MLTCGMASAVNTEVTPTSLWNLDYIDSKGTTPTQDGKSLSLYSGLGVHVFLFDTGIDKNNGSELDDVTVLHLDCIPQIEMPGQLTDDCAQDDPLGHGTRVAAIIAGETLGVAKKVTIYSRKITSLNTGTFRGSTFTIQSQILALKVNQVIDYISTNNIDPNMAIINFSAGFSQNDLSGLDAAFEQALINAKNAGILVVIAAGNNPQKSANDISPARLGSNSGIITIAGVDINFNASLSDGSVVDMYAPGVGLSTAGSGLAAGGGGGTPCQPIDITCNLSGEINGDELNGSSFSAPYVVGIAAKYLEYASVNWLSRNPITVEQAVKDNAVAPSNLNGLGNNVFVNSRFLLLEPEPHTIQSAFCFGYNTANWSSPKGVVGQNNTVSSYTLKGAPSGGGESTYYVGLGNFKLFSVNTTTYMNIQACKDDYCSTKVAGNRTARNYGSFCQ